MRKTVFIGLGGLGQRVVARIRKQVRELKTATEDLRFIAIDRDAHDLEQLLCGENIPVISLHDNQPIGERLHYYHGLGVEDWFPDAPAVRHSAPYSTCLRAVGRLDFIHAVQQDRLQPLMELLQELDPIGDAVMPLRIVVVTSLAGGTGSGMFIQLAAWLRKTIRMQWHKAVDICGVFAGAEIFTQTMQPGITACEQMRANAYAALQELELFTKVARGESVPGFEARMLDNLQLGAWENCPIYDRVDIYEYREGIARSFEQYLDQMAQSACLYYTSVLRDLEHGEIRSPELHFRTMGSAVARYSTKEILQYCSLRAALELSRANALEPGETEQLEKRAAGEMKKLADQVESVIHRLDIPDSIFEAAEKIKCNADVEAFLHQALDRLQQASAKMKTELPRCGETIFRDICSIWMPEEKPYCPLLYMDGKVLPPAKLGVLLRILIAKLKAAQEALTETADWDVFQPDIVPLPRGFQPVKPESGTAYPILVWKRLEATPFCILLIHKRKPFLNWFLEFCTKGIVQRRKAFKNWLLRMLLPRLVGELEALQQSVDIMNDRLRWVFVQNCKQYEARQPAETELQICADAKSRIYGDIGLQLDVAAVSEHYLRGLCQLRKEQMWPGYDGCEITKRIAADTLREILNYISDQLRENGAKLMAMNAAEAWCYAENSDGNALNSLCDRLDRNAAAALGNSIGSGKLCRRILGAADVEAKRKELENAAEAADMDSVLVAKDQDPSVIWCLRIEDNIRPEESSKASWREAYEWMCRRARNAGEAHFEPHMDKRWSAQLFGVE